jgi:hypothetical protein
MPCDISKAERGYRLFDSTSYSRLPSCAERRNQLDDSVAALGWHCSAVASVWLGSPFNGHWRLLVSGWSWWVYAPLQLAVSVDRTSR